MNIAAHHSMMGGKKAPTGYQVEYIDVGGYYFLTSFKPDNNSSFEANVAFIQRDGNLTIGTRNGWKDTAFMFACSRPNDTDTWYQWGNQASNKRFPTFSTYTKFKISIGRVSARAFAVDNSSKWTPSAATFQCSYPMTVGEAYSGGIPADSTTWQAMRFYDCKVWDNGVLALNLIPWVDGNGNPRIKDTLSEEILSPLLASNQSQTPYLTAGPIV